MKKIIYFLPLLVLLCFTNLFGQKYDTLAIYKLGGGIDKYATAKVDSIRYKGDTVLIRNNGVYVHYPMNGLDSLVFVEKVVIPTTVTDFDGNVYNTVIIGAQVWMKENLKTTHYADGTPISLVSGNSNWDTLTSLSKAYCWYNDDINNKDYGAYYTWAAAMNGAVSSSLNPSGIQGACPYGWHLPSNLEWLQMENYLADNGYNYDGTIGAGSFEPGMRIGKSLVSSSEWVYSSYPHAVGSTDYSSYINKSGFTAYPTSGRSRTGSFNTCYGCMAYWWCATENSPGNAIFRYIVFDNASLFNSFDYEDIGRSIRCVKN